MTLTEIGRKNYTEKANLGFLDIYENLWKDLQDKPITLLEIGVYNGNSIKTWLDWFHPNSMIIGIDKYPQPYVHDISKARLFQGDQVDIEFLQSVVERTYDGFDIIIDDGGHHWNEQQVSFKFLWKHLKSGGMYIIEDLQTSFDDFWKDGPLRTTDFLYNEVNLLLAYNENYSDYQSIQFYPKLAVLVKR